jgi:hypothetical protein
MFNALFNNSTSGPPESLLSEDQRLLFNGFEEIGGDVTMYQDAATWFKEIPLKYEAMTLCMAILDKPTSYLFGGVSNRKRKTINAVLQRVVEANLELENAEDEQQMMYARQRVKSIIEGCEHLRLEEDTVDLQEVGKDGVDVGLIRSCSLYTDSEIDSFDPEQILNMRSVRSWWKDEFTLVNVSRMKRAAIMYLELCNKDPITGAYKWRVNHGGKPSAMKIFGKNTDTSNIMKSDIEKFIKDKELWSRFKDIFNVKLGKDPKYSSNAMEYTRKQSKFMDMMSLPKIGTIYYGNSFGNGGVIHNTALESLQYEEADNKDEKEDDSSESSGIDGSADEINESQGEKVGFMSSTAVEESKDV